MTPGTLLDIFRIDKRVAVITGGAGLLGRQHAEVIAAAGGIPVIVDLEVANPQRVAEDISARFGVPALGCVADITQQDSVTALTETVLKQFGKVDILINNAANNPKMEATAQKPWSRLENFPIDVWNTDIAVGITGAFLCSRSFGAIMATNGKGVIVNVASDLAIIAPDQRLYRNPELPEDQQPVKPVTYSIVKTALLGLTRYLATYWATNGVRVNSISPGGVENGQPEDFMLRLEKLIPMGRMADRNEYQGAILFLCSDASSYMTGANLVIDGGRTCW